MIVPFDCIPGVRSVSDQSDNTRRFPRIPFRTRVHCTGRGLYFSDLTSNLSEGGLGLQTISNLEPGEELEIEFRLPESSKGFYVKTRVVWVKPIDDSSKKVNCGLEFEEIDDEERYKIRDYIQGNLG